MIRRGKVYAGILLHSVYVPAQHMADAAILQFNGIGIGIDIVVDAPHQVFAVTEDDNLVVIQRVIGSRLHAR
jgi:hypothetical protein